MHVYACAVYALCWSCFTQMRCSFAKFVSCSQVAIVLKLTLFATLRVKEKRNEPVRRDLSLHGSSF